MRKIIATLTFALASVACMAQLEPGLYKRTRYKLEHGPEAPFQFQFNAYKIVKPAGVLQLNLINEKPLKFRCTPTTIAEEDIIAHDRFSFDQRCVYKIPLIEHYDTRFKVDKDIPPLLSALSGTTHSDDNPLLGVWKCRDYNKHTEYYKIYTPKYIYALYIKRHLNDTHAIPSVQGVRSSVKYKKDGSTKENGNPCQIVWNGSTSYGLTYKNDQGLPVTEFWEQAELPADLTYWFLAPPPVAVPKVAEIINIIN